MRKMIDSIVILFFLAALVGFNGFLCQPIDIEIDIVPGNGRNLMHSENNALIKVAVYGSEELDIHDVQIGTVELRESVSGSKAKPVHSVEMDIDEDENADLVLFFRVADFVNGGWHAAHDSIDLELAGMTRGNNKFRGSDLVDLKPKGSSNSEWYCTI
ncbi:MAG: hypothetical protein ACMUIP_09040 [bacterium]